MRFYEAEIVLSKYYFSIICKKYAKIFGGFKNNDLLCVKITQNNELKENMR